MLLFFGTKAYGRIDVSGGTFIVTQFFYCQYLPLFPTASFLAIGPDRTGQWSYMRLPKLRGASVLAGYLRVWGVIGAIIAAALVLIESRGGFGAASALSLAIALALTIATVWSHVFLGKPSRDELGQRATYGTYAGYPFDVGLLGAAGDKLRNNLYGEIVPTARALADATYRKSHDPVADWDTIALSPLATDPAFLRAALTLARLEWGMAPASDPRRERLERAHQMIWAKLQRVG